MAAAVSPSQSVALPGGSGGASASGDFTYSYPIEVPAGRGAQQPTLALSYRSSAPVHGGVAAGWALPVAAVAVDPEHSTAGSRNFVDPAGNPLVADPGLPVSSGGVGYRALNDATFTRYEYLGGVASEAYWWRAFRSDGVVLRFGLKQEHPSAYAPLVSVVDGDNHALVYDYDVVGKTSDAVPTGGVPREILLKGIYYVAPGSTVSGAYARVLFQYAAPTFCGTPALLPAVGSRLDHRYGFAMLTGTRKLTNITTWARPQGGGVFALSRDYELGYSNTDSCATGSVTPYRQLASVQQRAYAPATSDELELPRVEFTYGTAGSYVTNATYQSAQELPNVVMPNSVQTVQTGEAFREVVPGKTFFRCVAKFCPVPGPDGSGTRPPVSDRAHMLAWGQTADVESVESMFIDINADGRVDQLRVSSPVELGRYTPGTGGCQVQVWINNGTAGFQLDPEVFSFSLRDAMADIPVTSPAGSDADGELLCSLSRSFSASNVGWRGDASKPCHQQWTAPASWGSMQQVTHHFLDVDGDRRPDLVSRPIASVDCPYASTQSIPPPTGTGVDWVDHFTADGGIEKITRRQMWLYIYRNTGTGFESTPTRVRSFEPTLPGPAVIKGAVSPYAYDSTPEMLMDITGDGELDLVTSTENQGPASVRVGDGLLFGDESTLSAGEKNDALTPNWAWDPLCTVGDCNRYMWFGAGPDVNGDGLADNVEAFSGGTEVAYNRGLGFGFGTAASGNASFFSSNVAETQFLTAYTANQPDEWYWNDRRKGWSQRDRNRMVDLDYDGLVDNYYFGGSAGGGRLYLNGGTAWVRSTPVDSAVAERLSEGFKHVGLSQRSATDTNEYGDRSDYDIAETSTTIDVNGDGLLDLVGNFDGDAAVEVRYAKAFLATDDDVNAPARLMRTVKNGYGAKTTVTYTRSQTADKWVVDKTVDSPGQNEPAIATEYGYTGATFKPNPYGRDRFRGFANVFTLAGGDSDTGADDLTTVAMNSYSDDPAGRLATAVTVFGRSVFDNRTLTGATGVMSITAHTYHKYDFGLYAPGMDTDRYPSRVVLPGTTTGYTCAGESGQSYNGCLSSPASSVTDEITWQSQFRNLKYVMHLATLAKRTFLNADGDTEIRRGLASYKIAWSSEAFNVAPETTSATTAYTDKPGVSHGSTTFAYHDSKFLRLDTVTVTEPDYSPKVTRFTYHTQGAQAGLVRKVWAPEQVAKYGTGDSAAGFTEITYDQYGLYPTKVVNPVGHVVTTVTDLGTGAVVMTQGPGYVCADGADPGTVADPASACTFATALHREGTITSVDGLGRVLNASIRPQDGSAPQMVHKTTYNDRASSDSQGANPVSVISETLIQAGQWSYQKVETDGLGRPVRQETRAYPNPDSVATFDYNERGWLSTAHAPRADNTAGTVDIVTTYDPLGRVKEVYDAQTSKRFVQHTYAGMQHVVKQGTYNDGSKSAEARMTYDPLGQLVSVAERAGTDAQNAPTFATTFYRYDGRGRTTSITDPDGVQTTMSHDFNGNRQTVTTGGRTWRYGYDRNDNLTSFAEPVPTGQQQLKYVHTRSYDDINRLLTQTPAVRDLTTAEQNELNIGPRSFFYDAPHASIDSSTEAALYQIGRSSYSIAHGIHNNQTQVRLLSTNTYDKYGNPARNTEHLPLLAGAPAHTLVATATSSPAGHLTDITYSARDGASTVFTAKKINFEYDRSGAPRRLSFVAPPSQGSSGTMAYVANRDDSGVLSSIVANHGHIGGYIQATTSYTHDKYGQLTNLQTATSAGSVKYRQDLTYYDNGEIKTASDPWGGLTTYDYDHRHQLLSATQSGSVGYHASFTYTPAGRMQSANVYAAANATRVPVRNVTHIYQSPATPGADRQRLAALRKPDGTDLASYTYDELGNTTSRTLPDGTTVTQRWDGPSLRKVTKSNGEKEIYHYNGPKRVAAVRYNSNNTIAETRRWFGELEVVYTPGQAPHYRQHVNLGGQTIARLDHSGTTTTLENYTTSPQGHHVLAYRATDGATRRLASYGPFGEILAETDTSDKYTREFNGKEYDNTSGLHYYGFRYYDPLALQWTSADPLYRTAPDTGAPRQANLYTYTANNPIGMVDPHGLDTERTDAGGTAPVALDPRPAASADVVVTHPRFGTPMQLNVPLTAEEHARRFAGGTAVVGGILCPGCALTAGGLAVITAMESDQGSGNHNVALAQQGLVMIGTSVGVHIAGKALATAARTLWSGRSAGAGTSTPPVPGTRSGYVVGGGNGELAQWVQIGNSIRFEGITTPIAIMRVIVQHTRAGGPKIFVLVGRHGDRYGRLRSEAKFAYEYLKDSFAKKGIGTDKVMLFDATDPVETAMFRKAQSMLPNDLFIDGWCYSSGSCMVQLW
ncbi:RHS repeat-associated core domain-containing protein [Catellatospora sp. NPDC049609]|uniref:RHS repeat-associated core domain-containing protein n=1 Tax=Catellatospora sp. NPDC049609 TaxID=3155505 RepID=UPI00341F393B